MTCGTTSNAPVGKNGGVEIGQVYESARTMMDIALEFKQFFDGLPATKGHIVAKMNWSRAKAPQPSLDKSEIWIPGDELARKSRRALSIWKRRLTDKQRKQLEIALTR